MNHKTWQFTLQLTYTWSVAYPLLAGMKTSLQRAVETVKSLVGVEGIRVGEAGAQTLGSASTGSEELWDEPWDRASRPASAPGWTCKLSSETSQEMSSCGSSWEEGLSIDSGMQSSCWGSEESTGSSHLLGESCVWATGLFSGPLLISDWVCWVQVELKSKLIRLLQQVSVSGEIFWLWSGPIWGALGDCGRASAERGGVETGNTSDWWVGGGVADKLDREEAWVTAVDLRCLPGVLNLETKGEETALVRHDLLTAPKNKKMIYIKTKTTLQKDIELG